MLGRKPEPSRKSGLELPFQQSLDAGGFALLNPCIGDELLGLHPASPACDLRGACWVIGSPLAAELLLGALPEHPVMEAELQEGGDGPGFGLSG